MPRLSYGFPEYNDSGSKAYTRVSFKVRNRKKAALTLAALRKARLTNSWASSPCTIEVRVPTVYYREACGRVESVLDRMKGGKP